MGEFVKTVHTGCCTELATHKQLHRWTKYMGTASTEMSEYKAYTICKSHEVLHHCVEEDGFSPSGKALYSHIAVGIHKGVCVGNVQSPVEGTIGGKFADQCPANMQSGPWCRCDGACGQ